MKDKRTRKDLAFEPIQGLFGMIQHHAMRAKSADTEEERNRHLDLIIRELTNTSTHFVKVLRSKVKMDPMQRLRGEIDE